MTITASAPGKLVLFGDHAVVYGYPSIVTSVGLRYTVTIEQIDDPFIEIQTPELLAKNLTRRCPIADLKTNRLKETAFVEAAVHQFFNSHAAPSGLKITTAGPELSYGLGSSSAVSVATIFALSHLFGIVLSLREIFNLSYAAVLDVQGTGSGVDVASAVYGGTISYVKDGAETELLNTRDFPILIAYSGHKVSTTNYIAQVAELQQRQPQFVNPIFDLMGKIVGEAKASLLAGDWQKLGDLSNLHQGLLDALNVTTPQLFSSIFAARTAGAWGAKLSGAGGGDCIFAIVPPEKKSEIAKSIQQANGFIVDLPVGVPGVRLES